METVDSDEELRAATTIAGSNHKASRMGARQTDGCVERDRSKLRRRSKSVHGRRAEEGV